MLDHRISEAIRLATEEHGQLAELADMLIAWMEELAEGNSSLDDRQATMRHLHLLYDKTVVTVDEDSLDAVTEQ